MKIVENNISSLYTQMIHNPPFFKTIEITYDDIVEYDLKRIFNMMEVNGKLYFIEKYKDFYARYGTVIQDKNMYYIVKKDNSIITFPNKRTSEFIIMGVQRGGTTALSYNLSKHKDIYIDGNKDPRKSEVHFFDLNWKKGIEWYKKHFDYSKKIVGAKSPDLLNLEYTFPMIQSVNPFMKLIIILKNPIVRAFSSWKMTTEYFGETRPFEEAIKEKPVKNKTFQTMVTQYLQRGLYYEHIKKLHDWFPKQNILILFSEEVIKNPEKEYNKIYDFLNVDRIHNKYEIVHKSREEGIDPKVYQSLIPYYKEDVEKLEKFLDIKISWFR